MTLRWEIRLPERGAKRGANAGRHRATQGDAPRRSVQVDGPAGDTQPHSGTIRLRLKSHVSPVGASRERENRDWCGEVRGWGCCRPAVLPADFADGGGAGDWRRAARFEAGFFPGIGVR